MGVPRFALRAHNPHPLSLEFGALTMGIPRSMPVTRAILQRRYTPTPTWTALALAGRAPYFRGTADDGSSHPQA